MSILGMVTIALLVVVTALLISILVTNARNKQRLEDLEQLHADQQEAAARTQVQLAELVDVQERAGEQMGWFLEEQQRQTRNLAMWSARRGVEQVMMGMGHVPQNALAADPHPAHEFDPHGGHEQWLQRGAPDHAGARAQLAERAGRPNPGALQVCRPAGQPPAGYRRIPMDGRYAAGAALPSAETEVFPAIRDANEPPEFSDENFVRRPEESEAAFKLRKADLTRRYNAWLAGRRSEVTGSFPAGAGTSTAAQAALAIRSY